jgi:hypothetical protein
MTIGLLAVITYINQRIAALTVKRTVLEGLRQGLAQLGYGKGSPVDWREKLGIGVGGDRLNQWV